MRFGNGTSADTNHGQLAPELNAASEMSLGISEAAV